MKKIIMLVLVLSQFINGFSQRTIKEWKVVNLSVNNGSSNSAASFYGDNQIVFSSEKDGRFHLYVGSIQNDDVKDKKPFIEAKTMEMSAAFTSNENTVYFTRSVYGKENTVKYNKDKASRIAIFKATKSSNGKWGNEISMPFNSNKYDVGHPALSPDNTKLYFSSNMPGTIGKTDIYVVDILGNGEYSEPKNLGKKVNTTGNELYPYVDKNNRLSFASNGHSNNMGGLDIYLYSLNSDEDLLHFDSPINSKSDDFSYVYNYNTKRGFLTSNRSGGKGQDDIYIFFEEEKEIKENKKDKTCSQELIGTVYLNATQEVIPFAIITLKDDNGNVVKTFATKKDAKFKFNVKCGTSYKIEATKLGHKTSERIMVTNGQNGVIGSKNIFLTKKVEVASSKEKKDFIGKVGFEYNKTNLEKRYTYELDKAIIKMKKNKKITIHFESHTDSRAETDFNMELSVERIRVLKEYLGFNGIYRKRITGDAFGETKPLNRCTKEVECTESEYLLNRRTTFVLKGE